MSDTESYVYRYSWDKEDLASYPWKEHYVKQPEVLAYLNHIADRHDLRKDMRFNTQMLGAHWDDANNRWNIKITGDKVITARYLVTGLGLLSKQNYPDIPGIDSFEGDVCTGHPFDARKLTFPDSSHCQMAKGLLCGWEARRSDRFWKHWCSGESGLALTVRVAS